ncbi:MAG: aminomethyl-transferring glycine dehydrogenase subunit GcvPA [Spirochaetaceae bacterium]|nr:MAG: aminomethyl-transferring glycine dehydrogenase subunit GcvPA [Spirochaetaceae bacterium]
MAYISNTPDDVRVMLGALGLNSCDQLFDDVPEHHRFPKIDLKPELSEMDTLAVLSEHADRNTPASSLSFLGGGAWNHFIPSVVDALASRGEFTTSYTPYQAEVSQGTLQALFEYQSLIAELTGMDVVNASHYDGATAVAEAALMSVHASRDARKKIVLSRGVHPYCRSVTRAYLDAMDAIVVGDDLDHSPGELAAQCDSQTACLVVQFPDFYGRTFDLDGLAETVHAAGALLVVHVDPIALGLYKDPGSLGADIVTGEGQPLGIPVSFGGPYLGIFACRTPLIRRMPGRLAGETLDSKGRRGFVLTLNTREQHIRREKATSNICTNQGLMALRAAIYLSAMGPTGLREVAELCYHRANYAAHQIAGLPGFTVDFTTPFFKEFVVTCPIEAESLVEMLLPERILAGVPLSRFEPGRANDLLVAVTEMNSKTSIDTFIEALSRVASVNGKEQGAR